MQHGDVRTHVQKKGFNVKTPAKFLSNVRATFTRIQTTDLKPNDVIIAVMGSTGAGKSTFISKALGHDDLGIGHTLESETAAVTMFRLSIPDMLDGDLVFVDTPGFDDTHVSDLEILKMVSKWLQETYEKEFLLSGILYFHRITDNRMAGTPLRNLHSFEKLVGKQSLDNVMLVSTMWDEIEDDLGEKREDDLKRNYWNYMISRGSGTARFMGSKESAFTLIQPLLDKANERHALRLQKELVKLHRELAETTVGQELFSKLEFVLNERQDAVNRLRKAIKDGDGRVDQYRVECDAAEAKVTAVMRDMQALKIPFFQRVATNLRGWFAR
jgi:GTP-binding protein EngB required for normal cell division